MIQLVTMIQSGGGIIWIISYTASLVNKQRKEMNIHRFPQMRYANTWHRKNLSYPDYYNSLKNRLSPDINVLIEEEGLPIQTHSVRLLPESDVLSNEKSLQFSDSLFSFSYSLRPLDGRPHQRGHSSVPLILLWITTAIDPSGGTKLYTSTRPLYTGSHNWVHIQLTLMTSACCIYAVSIISSTMYNMYLIFYFLCFLFQ